MKTNIDYKTGAVTFIPECQLDKQLLFHLMDCADLTHFSDYIQNYPNMANVGMTTDLGVAATDILGYPCHSLPTVNCTPLPWFPEKPVSLYMGDRIGFNRFESGKVTDCMIDDFENKQR
jgi:hypothetical protein